MCAKTVSIRVGWVSGVCIFAAGSVFAGAVFAQSFQGVLG